MRAHITRRDRAGFTILEILAAVLILGFVLTSVYILLVASVRANDRVNEILDASRAGPAILLIMEEDLREAFLPTGLPKAFQGEDGYGGSGDADKVDFVTARDSRFTDPEREEPEEEDEEPVFSDVTEVGYFTEPSEERSGLLILYRREAFTVDDEPFEDGIETLLYDGIASFRIQYSVPPDETSTSEWQDGWDPEKESGLPRAVRIELELVPPTGGRDDWTGSEPLKYETIVILETPQYVGK